jgi:N-carbamoylputrescine amidase
MITIAIVEWPDGLLSGSGAWEKVAADVAAAAPDLLITNEMPFGAWRPINPAFDKSEAAQWIDEHEHGLAALASLTAKAVLSSRPVPHAGRLANEAFVIEAGTYRPLHRKQYFPEETGWQEASWFGAERSTYKPHQILGLSVGVLLCTELMFNEHARALGRNGADLIVTPRATGRGVASWETATRMAALVSGAYIASSNRVGSASQGGPDFGGHALIVERGGGGLIHSSAKAPLVIATLDQARTHAAKLVYPCYVKEIG